MAAKFILSLDCEGKWGVADHLDRGLHASLSDANLRTAYRHLLALLDEYGLTATFAVVGCFAEPSPALERKLDRLRDLARAAPHYLGPALDDMMQGSREGWHGEWAVEAVASAKAVHELALHGVTHVPWTDLDRRGAEDEIAFLEELETPVRRARTFVYPRNKIAHSDVLAAAGIAGYRLSRPARSRLASLASEFDVWSKPEPTFAPTGPPMGIPAGYFVNWQSGPRKLVPQAVSVLRLRNMLDRAEQNGDVVHYWLHPENIATAPATLDLLRRMVEVVATRRDRGRCEVLTQAGYVERTIPRAGSERPQTMGPDRC